MLLKLGLLWADQQEIHDRKDQNKRDKLAEGFHVVSFLVCGEGPPLAIDALYVCRWGFATREGGEIARDVCQGAA